MGWRRKLGISEETSASQFAIETGPEPLIKAFKSGLVVSTSDYDSPNETRIYPTYTPQEVAKRNGQTMQDSSEASTWLVIKDKVYDVTSFMLLEHPGGKEVIEAFAGKQCDWQFEYFHHPRHLEQYHKELLVGYVSPSPPNPFPRPPKELKADWRVE